MSFAQNAEDLYVIKIITNNIVAGCSVAIALQWSNVVDSVLHAVFPQADGSPSLWTQAGAAFLSSIVLTVFAAIALKVGGAVHRARQRVAANLAEASGNDAARRPPPTGGTARRALAQRSASVGHPPAAHARPACPRVPSHPP